MPATLIDETRTETLPWARSGALARTPGLPTDILAASRVNAGPGAARRPSRRRRRVTGRLSRLAALVAMGAWIALGLMPIAAVLLAVYGS